MKALLMRRDDDFDPGQVLVRREKESHMHQRYQETTLDELLPWNADALIQDLGLEILFEAMALGDRFLFEVAEATILSPTTDVETILYRQDVLRDCMRLEPAVREMYQIAVVAIERERKNFWSLSGRYPASTLYRAVEVLQMFVGLLKELRRIADQNIGLAQSAGLSRFFSMLRHEISDDYFCEIERYLKQLKFRRGVLISAQLGMGNKGTAYVLHELPDAKSGWLLGRLWHNETGYTYWLHPRDESGARALSELKNQGVNLAADALAKSADHILSFFQMLRTELGFYIGCLNLRKQLDELGEPSCFPVPLPRGKQGLAFSELYDVCLALKKGQKIVGNDLDAGPKGLIVITGANTGGKSTFLRGLGLGQLMMQSGMFVPARTFTAEIRKGIYTHFKREEDVTMESGKLDEELLRMSEIVDHLGPDSLVLFNESFATTNEREGSEIARQVVSALTEKCVKCAFVTHLYDFARRLYAEKRETAVFLRAERLSDGTRTFRLLLGEPLQTSYGKDLYTKIFGGRSAERTERVGRGFV